MATRTCKLKASCDDLYLSVVATEPQDIDIRDAVAVIQMVHGMAEHKERYIAMMEFLSSKGYICVMHDNRGHGQSVKDPSDLGYMYTGKARGLVEDVLVVNKWIKQSYPGKQVYLYGHSMGSLIVRCYLKEHDDTIDGLIVCGSPSANSMASMGKAMISATALLNGGNDKAWRKVVPLFTKMSTGQYAKGLPAGSSLNAWICTDPKVVEAYDQDPLSGFPFTLNGYYSLMDLMVDCYSPKGYKVNSPRLPIWFIAGELDPCIVNKQSWDNAQAALRGVGYQSVSCKMYPGMRHEIHNEVGKEGVWADIQHKIDSWAEEQ